MALEEHGVALPRISHRVLRTWQGNICERWLRRSWPAGAKTIQAVRRDNPVRAVARVQKIADVTIRQAIGNGVVREPLAVEHREALHRSKPEPARSVAADAHDPVARQAVFGGEEAD